MSDLFPSDLRDPQPPAPGDRERALVATRARALGRRRRLLQGGGALALVAAMAVSVAALTAGGSSSPSGASRVEAASGAGDRTTAAPVDHVTTVPSTLAPAPTVATTPAPAPAPDTTPAAVDVPAVTPQSAAPVTPAAPTTFTLSGTVTGNPAGTTVTLTVSGPGGPFTGAVDGAGNFSLSGLEAGDYSIIGEWYDGSGTAGQASRLGAVSLTQDSSVNLSF